MKRLNVVLIHWAFGRNAIRGFGTRRKAVFAGSDLNRQIRSFGDHAAEKKNADAHDNGPLDGFHSLTPYRSLRISTFMMADKRRRQFIGFALESKFRFFS
jgi:hypothetical protein